MEYERCCWLCEFLTLKGQGYFCVHILGRKAGKFKFWLWGISRENAEKGCDRFLVDHILSMPEALEVVREYENQSS